MSKKLKEKIEALEKKHRLVAGNLLDAIWVIDVETLQYDYVTPSIEKISGYAVDEYMKFTIIDRMTPKSFQKVEAVITDEMPKEVELTHTICPDCTDVFYGDI